MQKYLQRKDVPDLQKFWLLKQEEYLKRIEKPAFRKMHDYLKDHLRQEDYNFFYEMVAIQDEYTDHLIEINSQMDPPVVITDPANRHKQQLIAIVMSKALKEELIKITG